ncbi:MAG: lysoplasmalogenase [Flavobacteriaceae bacterium]|nr:lysoplasmalogenase [Flavobacteriaceae bacterium]
MNKKIALFIFASVAFLDLLGIIFKIEILRLVFKPLILLSLIALYVISTKKEINKTYVFALVFSFLGDVFLLFDGTLFFMLGLGSFLIAHLFFIKVVVSWWKLFNLKNTLLIAIPFGVLVAGLILFLNDYLGEMLLPVIVYALVIGAFGTVATILYKQHRTSVAFIMMLGAFVFMSSDTVLSINLFYKPMMVLNILVMLSYVIAQYLIYKSVVLKGEM